MDWLTQNWVWILFAIGAVWLFSRGGMAGCGMGGHGSHAGHGGGAAPDGSSPGTNRSGGGVAATIPEKVLDPVSGHEVLTAHAPSAVYQGRFFFFESAENRQRFEAAPQKYASNAPVPPLRRRHGGC